MEETAYMFSLARAISSHGKSLWRIWHILLGLHCLLKYLFMVSKMKRANTLTLKVPITTAADNKFCDIFPNFQKK